MSIWIILIIVFGVAYYLNKSFKQTIERETASVFFKVDFNHKNIVNHPFIKQKLIPALKEHKYTQSEINDEVEKIKKEVQENRRKYPDLYKNDPIETKDELEQTFWNREIYQIFNQPIEEYGKDRSLAFRIFNAGSTDNRFYWDGVYKSFGNSDPEFVLDTSLTGKNFDFKYVRLAGKKRIVKRNNESLLVFSVYLTVNQGLRSEKEDDTTEVLIDIPYQLLSWYRYQVMLKRDQFNKLLSKFNLKLFGEDHDGDVYKDTLGDWQSTGKDGVTIGNEYVEFWIV